MVRETVELVAWGPLEAYTVVARNNFLLIKAHPHGNEPIGTLMRDVDAGEKVLFPGPDINEGGDVRP